LRADQIDLGDAVGAEESGSIQRLTLYIPSRDRAGVEFDPSPWVEEALRLLSRIGGGATAMPPADGSWLDPDHDTLVREKVVLAYTFIDPDQLEAMLPELRRFLHKLGRETGQGEVVCEFDGVLYKIRDYDR
jgi:hypothetical protein